MAKKILIVDDEADVRTFLVTLLEAEGYETVTAEDGLDAWEVAQREKPDLVTLDLQMHDKTGTDFYRRVDRDPGMRDLPIIVISGLSGRELAVKRAVAVFDKPIDQEKFLGVVKDTLG